MGGGWAWQPCLRQISFKVADFRIPRSKFYTAPSLIPRCGSDSEPLAVSSWPRASHASNVEEPPASLLFPCSSRHPEPRYPQLSAAMSAEVKVTGQNQEQFLLLAKSAKGAALATLIHQVLEAPGVYVFGELLDMPNVREVGSWPG